jgi:hypothetical protein
MERITCFFYTNETYSPIANLAIDEFNKFSKDLEIKKILVSNRFDSEDKLPYADFKKIDAGVEFRPDTRHFAKVLLKGLEQVDTKYILFMLDDTFIMNDIKKTNLDAVLNFMDGEDIDHFSLMSYGHNWEVMDIDYQKYGLPNNYIFKMVNSYVHLFSLQPSIWKTESFIEILKHNIEISIKEFDISQFKNKRGEYRGGANAEGYIDTPEDFWDYGLKHCCFKRYFENTPYPFDDRDEDGDYFLFLWSEAIYGGKFNVHRHQNCKKYMVKFLEEKNITKEDNIYGKYILE